MAPPTMSKASEGNPVSASFTPTAAASPTLYSEYFTTMSLPSTRYWFWICKAKDVYTLSKLRREANLDSVKSLS